MKAAWWATVEAFEKALIQLESFVFLLLSPFLNSASMASSSMESWMSKESTSLRIGSNNWLATSFKVIVISPQERKKCERCYTTNGPSGKGWTNHGNGTNTKKKWWPLIHWLVEVHQWNFYRKLFVHLLLPTQWCTRPKFEEDGYGWNVSLTNSKIGDKESQRSPRNVEITPF